MLVSLKGVYETIRLPITVGRAIVAVVAMAREWEALHFRERRKVKMGFGSVIDRQTWLLCGENIELGEFCKISAYSAVLAGRRARIILGDNTIVGPGVTIVAFNHGTADRSRPIRFQPWDDREEGSVVIEEDVWIGAGATILPGTRIGRGAIVGAGAIVKGSIPAYSVISGMPSRSVRARKFAEGTSSLDPVSSAVCAGKDR